MTGSDGPAPTSDVSKLAGGESRALQNRVGTAAECFARIQMPGAVAGANPPVSADLSELLERLAGSDDTSADS
jgi:hypothetical protein